MKIRKENLLIIILLSLSIGFASGYGLSFCHNQQFDKIMQSIRLINNLKHLN